MTGSACGQHGGARYSHSGRLREEFRLIKGTQYNREHWPLWTILTWTESHHDVDEEQDSNWVSAAPATLSRAALEEEKRCCWVAAAPVRLLGTSLEAPVLRFGSVCCGITETPHVQQVCVRETSRCRFSIKIYAQNRHSYQTGIYNAIIMTESFCAECFFLFRHCTSRSQMWFLIN